MYNMYKVYVYGCGRSRKEAVVIIAPIDKSGFEILSADGTTLRGFIVDNRDARRLVVVCHGIPRSSEPDPHDPGYAGFAEQLAEAGYSTVHMNFRGTGESSGNLYMSGWYADLEAEMRYVMENRAERFERVFLAGSSAGGALSIIYAAQHHDIDGVAVFAAPSRISEIFPREETAEFIEDARQIGTITDTDFPPSADWYYDDMRNLEALDYVARIAPTPLLIIHGDEDETVPVEQGVALYEEAGEPKELSILPGGVHRLRTDPRTFERFTGWMDRI